MESTDPATQAALAKLNLARAPIQEVIDLKVIKEDGDPPLVDEAIWGATKMAEAGIMFDLGVNKVEAAAWLASLTRKGLAAQVCECDYGRNHPQHLSHEGFCGLHYTSVAVAIGGKRYCTGCAEAHGEFGALTDYVTGERIGPATREQRDASRQAGVTGAFKIDRDGGACAEDADEAVYGPTRWVFVAY
jgi:hypothetical protein